MDVALKWAARVAAGMVREGKPAKRARAEAIVLAFATAYPMSQCALRHDSPFQLLVATVLSAQTTDVAVNHVTRRLFRSYPDAAALAAAPDGAIEAIINSIGLWRNKAKNIRAIARIVAARHGGGVPSDLESLQALPGVGKKTATAVLGTAFGTPAGVTVDTHMLRINRLLGLSRHTDPEKMAHELERLLPVLSWTSYTHRVIDHGRLVCVARGPRCGVCPLAPLCPSAFLPIAGYKQANDERTPASAAAASWLARTKD